MTSSSESLVCARIQEDNTSALTRSDHQKLFQQALGDSALCYLYDEVNTVKRFRVSCKCDLGFIDPTVVALLQVCIEHRLRVAFLDYRASSIWEFTSFPMEKAIPLLLKAGLYPTSLEFVKYVLKCNNKNNWKAFASSFTDVQCLITPEVYAEFGAALQWDRYRDASRMMQIGLPVRLPEIKVFMPEYTDSLMRLCLQGNSKPLLEKLLQAGGDPNEICRDQVPLYHLVQARCEPTAVERLKLMLEHGADPNGVSDIGIGVGRKMSLLEAAVYAGFFDAAFELIKAGADPHQRNTKGQTLWFPLVLNYKASVQYSAGVVSLLTKHGVDINVVDSDGRTALSYCTSTSLFKYLVNNGASVRNLESPQFSYARSCLEYCRLHMLQMLMHCDAALPLDVVMDLEDVLFTPGLFKMCTSHRFWRSASDQQKTHTELQIAFEAWTLRCSMGTFLMGVRKTDQGSKQSPLERFVDDPHFDANVLGMMADFIVPRKHRKPVTRRNTHWDPAPDASSAAPDASSSSSSVASQSAVKKQRLD